MNCSFRWRAPRFDVPESVPVEHVCCAVAGHGGGHVCVCAVTTEVARITCPICGMTSYNPTDIAEGYCGNCHDWTTPRGPVRKPDRKMSNEEVDQAARYREARG